MISPQDIESIKKAKTTLQNLNWAIRNVNKIGNKLETSVNLVPEKTLQKIQKATKTVLFGIIKANLITIKKHKKFKKPAKNTYKALVTSTGTLSGFFGSTTGIGTAIFISELTVSTKFLMRTIMDIARSEGEDIYSLEGQIACLQVFALGDNERIHDQIESSYYSSRMLLNSSLKKVTASSVKIGLDTLIKGINSVGSNALTSLITATATRLSLLISEKFIAQAVPIIGAVGGGALNYIFVDHFQKMALAHFTLRRLERKYNEDLVKKTFESIEI